MEQEIINKLAGASIDVKEAIRRFNNNEALYKKCLSIFPQESTYEEVLEAIDAGNFENARRAVHTLKGISSNLGIAVLTDACTTLLIDLRNGTGVLNQEQYEDLKRTYEKTRGIINECIAMFE